MTDLDPGLAAKLRQLSEERIRTQVQAAKRQAIERRQTRQEFARRRDRGLTERHALKQARQNLIDRHQEGDQP